ncbi:MAG: hypothetical protein IKW00_02540 [Clostridia bacterium]|nr:hypothetical protein [Clostridia bacterium]
MNRTEILNALAQLDFDKREYWVITGGAMVLYGLRDKTHDIDLGCTKKLADALEKAGCPVHRNADGSRHITFNEDVELLENWLFDKVDTVEGFPVISMQGLLEMKKNLGREKDLRDVALIEAAMNK